MVARVRASDPEITVEEAVAQANKDGWLLSSLYQNHMGQEISATWNAALRPLDDWTLSYGIGSTAGEAIMDAFKRRRRRMTNTEWDEFRRKPKRERVRSS